MRKAEEHAQWTGAGQISGNWWQNHVLRRYRESEWNREAKQCTITVQAAWDLFVAQEGRCALSGLSIDFTGRTGTASLDRIDNTRGYAPDNVQWVHKHINMMKHKYEGDYFIRMCCAVAKYSGGGACEVI